MFLDVDRLVILAHRDVELGHRFQRVDLVVIVRALVDVADVHCALEGFLRQVGPAHRGLGRRQSLQRVDQRRAQPVVDALDDVDRRREIAQRGFEIAGFVLRDGEIRDRLRRVVAVETVELDREFDDAFRQRVGLQVLLVLQRLPVQHEQAAEFLGVLLALRRRLDVIVAVRIVDQPVAAAFGVEHQVVELFLRRLRLVVVARVVDAYRLQGLFPGLPGVLRFLGFCGRENQQHRQGGGAGRKFDRVE